MRASFCLRGISPWLDYKRLRYSYCCAASEEQFIFLTQKQSRFACLSMYMMLQYVHAMLRQRKVAILCMLQYMLVDQQNSELRKNNSASSPHSQWKAIFYWGPVSEKSSFARRVCFIGFPLRVSVARPAVNNSIGTFLDISTKDFAEDLASWWDGPIEAPSPNLT